MRKTGGLADTVFDMDDQLNHNRANGYSICVCAYLFIYLVLTGKRTHTPICVYHFLLSYGRGYAI